MKEVYDNYLFSFTIDVFLQREYRYFPIVIQVFFVTVVFFILLFSLIQALYVNVDSVSSSSDEDSSFSSLSQSFRITMKLHFSHVLLMHV